MVFNSIEFLLFFPIVIFIYFLVPIKIKYVWLLLCSYFFYMCWNPAYIILLFFSTFITYFCAVILEKLQKRNVDERRRLIYKKTIILIAIILNMGLLFLFKYYNFFQSNINYILSFCNIRYSMPEFDVLLPVGISFYIFQTTGYIIDVYRQDVGAEKNFFKYALFVSFFPQLVAGPIERSSNLLKQIKQSHRFDYFKFRDGALLMLWGLFLKMVISDRIAIFVDTVYGDVDLYEGWYLIVASILFAFQIYCDFAGYSTIAVGAAEILGFHLTDNFSSPYLAKSVSEFWRRWHITLSKWFRDYIYIPLGGNRKGRTRKYVNIMIVFLLSGLWHGANWTYLIWGGINGLFQILGELLKPVRNKLNTIFKLNRKTYSHKLYNIVITFILVDLSWIFFRSEGIGQAFHIFKSMFHANNIWILFDDSLFALGLDWKNFLVMLTGIFLLLTVDFCKYKGIALRKKICDQEMWFRWLAVFGGVVSILFWGIWGSHYNADTFIYFQF